MTSYQFAANYLISKRLSRFLTHIDTSETSESYTGTSEIIRYKQCKVCKSWWNPNINGQIQTYVATVRTNGNMTLPRVCEFQRYLLKYCVFTQTQLLRCLYEAAV